MHLLPNIVSVIKKNIKVHVCVDFRNLNLATPKDEYVMPISNMLVDSTTNNGILTFMDDYSGYNHIFIAKEDVQKTAFRCYYAIGIFKWVVIPFGRTLEVYINNVVVKLAKFDQHFMDLN